MIRYLIIFITILLTSCSFSNQEQNKEVIIKDGMLISVEGIDVAAYEIEAVEFKDMNYLPINKNTLLCYAAEDCNEALIRKVIEKGGDVKSKCDNDDLVTWVALCGKSSLPLTKLLIEQGASIHGKDQENANLLSYAIGEGDIDFVKYLLDKGADKNNKDTNPIMGCFPIHSCESLGMIKFLEREGFDLNRTCDNGENLLHFAARFNFVEMADYLVKNKLTNQNKKNKDGKTPLALAIEFDKKEVKTLLESQ